MYEFQKAKQDYNKKKVISRDPIQLPLAYITFTFTNKYVRLFAAITVAIHTLVSVFQLWTLIKTRDMIYLIKYGPPFIGVLLPIFLIVGFYKWWPLALEIVSQIHETFWEGSSAGVFLQEKHRREINYLNIYLKAFIFLIVITACAIMSDIQDKYEVFFAITVIKENFPQYRYPLTLAYISTFAAIAQFLGLPVFIASYFGMTLVHQMSLVASLLENVATDIPKETGHHERFEMHQGEIYRRIKFCVQQIVIIRRVFHQIQEVVWRFSVVFVILSIAMGVSILVYFYFGPVFPKSHYHRVVLFALAGCLYIVTPCVVGQRLEDLSNILLDIPYYLPWYEWNKKNKQMVHVLLLLHQRPLVFSIYGNIGLNNVLMISVLKNLYTIAALFGDISVEHMQ